MKKLKPNDADRLETFIKYAELKPVTFSAFSTTSFVYCDKNVPNVI